jgi:hypothetical protein
MTDQKDKEPTLPSTPTLPSAQPEIVEALAPTDDPIQAITEGVSMVVSKAEKLAQLREAREVVEDDSDLTDIFMFVRGDIPLTKKALLESFPNAKALVITQEQLWQIEDCVDNDPESAGNRFVYINTSGKKRTVKGDYLEEEPLVIFIEELGEEPATSLKDSPSRKALPSRDLVYK